MSIATEITRLQTAKSDLKTAIELKGVTVPSSATIDTYDNYVSQISGGDCEDFIGMIERSATAITIPSGTTSIAPYTFYQYSGLTSVNIPSGVTSIGDAVFYQCSGLTSVNIPSSVTSIGEDAFSECYSLTSITIGNGVTSIGNYAFSYCSSLTSINIPSGVTSIGDSAFSLCSGLTSVTVNAVTPPTLGNNAFNNTPIASGTGYIYVPSASVNTYKTTSGWSTYASRIQAIP